MKTNRILLLALVAFSISLHLSGQIDIGTSWVYPITGYPFRYTTQVNEYVATGNMVINDTAVVKIEKTYVSCELRPDAEYIYVEEDQWYYYDEDVSHFKLLYDFGLEVGDTMKLKLWDAIVNFGGIEGFGSLPFDIDIIVDSISLISYGNENRKVFHVRYEWQDEYFVSANRTIIEGIGSLNSFMHFEDNGVCDLSWNHSLRCFISDTDTLNFSNIGCYTVLSSTDEIMDSQEDHHISIYPNHSDGNITIETPSNQVSNLDIELYTLSGQTAYKQKIETSGTIHLGIKNKVNPGIYLVKIYDELSGKLHQEKIVIH